MEKSSLIHQSDSIYSFPISKDEVEIRLLTKKDDDIKKVELMYNDKYKFHEGVKTTDIHKTYSDDRYDYYIIKMKLKDLRFAYVFKITTYDDSVYYYSESGVTTKYDVTKGFYDFFQVSYINDNDLVLPSEKIRNRVFYQIFVDRFFKSKDNDNERINLDWGNLVNRYTIAGGNLKGINEKIDYLTDLGINALYLTPIFESDSNHKYNIKDYYKIAKDFGNEEDLTLLVNKLHDKDILIFLDGVFNHISYDNEIFQDVIKNGNKSKYFNWFFIHGDNLDLKKNNYERFADDLGMPRLNLNQNEVQEYVIDVCLYYVKKYHIDGLRLDVSDEIPHYFWIRLKRELKRVNKDFILIGENWHNASSFLNSGYEFDSIMNYCITKELLNFVAWRKYSPLDFKNHIISDLMRYKTNINYNMFNLLSSHDIYRFINECNKDVDRFLLGYAFIFMHIGSPCVYYGDEIGLEGNFDPDNRRCFIWDEDKWNKKIRNTIKDLIKFHKDSKINEFDYNINVLDDLVVVRRTKGNEEYILYMNLSGSDKKIESNQVISNLYENKILKNKGFIIERK